MIGYEAESTKLIKKDRLGELLAATAESEALHLPVDRDDGNAEYRRYEEGTELSSQHRPPVIPQTENLVDFKLSGNNIEVIDSAPRVREDFVIFAGVNAMPQASVLDRVFIETPPEDTFYKNRREHALSLALLACRAPLRPASAIHVRHDMTGA